jgi:hypothetical protein
MPANFFGAPAGGAYGGFVSPGGGGFAFNAPAVGGALPFNQPTPAMPTNAAGLAAAYAQSYGNARNFNASNYENILSGYQSTIAAQDAGYQSLYADVMGTIAGMERGRAQGIQDAAAAEIGGATQSLIDRGLGNTTVQQTVVSGVNANRDRRLTELSGEMAGIRGSYMSQLGQARLQTVGGLQSQQLQWMNSLNAPYPDAGMYAQLAQQYGATGAADDAARRIAAAGQPAAPYPGGGGGGRLGYTPPPRFTGGPAGAQAMPGGTGGGYSMFAQPAPSATNRPDPAWMIGGNAVGMVGDTVDNSYGGAWAQVGGAVNGYGNAVGSVGAQMPAGGGLGMLGGYDWNG